MVVNKEKDVACPSVTALKDCSSLRMEPLKVATCRRHRAALLLLLSTHCPFRHEQQTVFMHAASADVAAPAA